MILIIGSLLQQIFSIFIISIPNSKNFYNEKGFFTGYKKFLKFLAEYFKFL